MRCDQLMGCTLCAGCVVNNARCNPKQFDNALSEQRQQGNASGSGSGAALNTYGYGVDQIGVEIDVTGRVLVAMSGFARKLL